MSECEDPQIVELDSTTSTQDIARSLLAVEPCPQIVVAKAQTAGRGRCGRSWCSPIGGLYATLILPACDLVSARAALAVANGLLLAGIDPSIKWPNDLLVGGEKIAGLLIEAVGNRMLVGVGINICTSPIIGATHIGAHVSSPPDPRTLAAWIWHSWPYDAAATVLAEYRRRCATLGRQVRVECGSGFATQVCGVAVDVDRAGALVVARNGGEKHMTVTCGDCVHLASGHALFRGIDPPRLEGSHRDEHRILEAPTAD